MEYPKEPLIEVEVTGPATITVVWRGQARGCNVIEIPGTGLALVVKPRKEANDGKARSCYTAARFSPTPSVN